MPWRISLFALALFLSLSALPDRAEAWGKFGHLVVCDLAYRNLTDTSRAKLRQLFHVDQGGITVKGKGKMADRHYTSFNLGCLEEDQLPRKHPEDHFINVSRQTPAISEGTCPSQGECIFSGVQRDLETLKDNAASDEDRVFALMAVGHWIGDIHQPLHISFADDRGGNQIEAKLKGKCGQSSYHVTNLHGVWDNCLLEAGLFERVRQRADFKKSWGKNTITYRAVDTLQANTGLVDEQSLVSGAPWQWAEESYEITLRPDVFYCVMKEGICQYSESVVTLDHDGVMRRVALDQSYLKEHERIAEERVRRAGFRLAHLLNTALDPAYTSPVRNSAQPQ